MSIAPESNFKRWGAYVGLVPENSGQITETVQCGIYSEPNEALRIFQDRLKQAVVSPRDIDERPPGQQSAGWWNEDYGDFERVLFVRDNIVADLRLLPGGVHSYRSAKEMASALDGALTDTGRVEYGIEGDTRRANQVQIPRIVAVEMPSEAVAGSTIEAKAHIVVRAAQDDQAPASKDVEITRAVRFIVPAAPGESGGQMAFELTYITADCRVASRKVILTVKPAIAAHATKSEK